MFLKSATKSGSTTKLGLAGMNQASFLLISIYSASGFSLSHRNVLPQQQTSSIFFILILNLNLQRESFRLSRHSAFLCITGGVGVAPTENIILHLHRYRLSHPQLSPSKKGRNLIIVQAICSNKIQE